MATLNEKDTLPGHEVNSAVHSLSDSNTLELPNSWKYKRLTILGFKLPWFASPPVQLVIVSLVCFMCPGMFNALNGMGGGGQLDPLANNRANTALYSTFAVVGFFAGTFTNKLGIRTALSFGGIGYSIYVAAYLPWNHLKTGTNGSGVPYNSAIGFTTFAGALLGVCAGLLWCAQGAIMMSYPPEASKGRYISWFWMIFNLGAVIGSLVGHALFRTTRHSFTTHLLTFADSSWSEHQRQDRPVRQRWHIHRIPCFDSHWSHACLDACRCKGRDPVRRKQGHHHETPLVEV
jgi:hypothetical protein